MFELTATNFVTVTPSEEFDTRPLNKRYTAPIFVAQALAARHLPYDLHRLWDGWQVVVVNGNRRADIAQHSITYGANQGFVESMGFDEDEDDVSGYLTVEDAVARIEKFLAK